EGGPGSVAQAVGQAGGQELSAGFWTLLREHRLPFFKDARPLWRISVPPQASVPVRPAEVRPAEVQSAQARPAETWPGDALLDWGGAQIWLKSDASPAAIRQLADKAGGHATCYTPAPGVEPFHPLPEGLMRFHQQLKHQMDPHGIFNPGRMY